MIRRLESLIIPNQSPVAWGEAGTPERGRSEEEKSQECLTSVYPSLMGWCKDDRVFSLLSSDRTKGNGHKLKYRKFHFKKRQ